MESSQLPPPASPNEAFPTTTHAATRAPLASGKPRPAGPQEPAGQALSDAGGQCEARGHDGRSLQLSKDLNTVAAAGSRVADATGAFGPARNPQNPDLPATDALIEKLRVRQAVLFRVRSVALRPEERQVLDELLNETCSELAGIHRVLADARGPEHRGAHTENPNPVRAVNGVRAAPFWETRQAFHIEAARVAARERLSRPESESGERGPLHFGAEGRP